MHHEIVFVEGQIPDALVTVSGQMTVEGSEKWLAELVGDPRWRPGMKTLVDMTDLLPINFDGSGVRAVADTTVNQSESWGAGCSAVIVSNEVLYGLLRVWQAVTVDMEWKTDIFYTREEALAWLENPT